LADLPEDLCLSRAGLSPRKKYLIGVSGGRDSMVLLFALHARGFTRLTVCHLNHGLRGNAAKADARLVERSAHKLGLAFELGEADVKTHARTNKQSIESAARELRHAFFQTCAKAHRSPRIFLAHHADDQVETCLFNFLRGSGTAGLGGMKMCAMLGRLELIRPMLAISRAEISAYAKANRIPYRDDASNQSAAHTRNRIRASVLPVIEKAVGPSFRAAILRAAEISREEDRWMESLISPAECQLSCPGLRSMPEALRRRTVLRWLREQGVKEPGFAETERVLGLLDTAGPAKVNLPGNLHARRRSGRIFLDRP